MGRCEAAALPFAKPFLVAAKKLARFRHIGHRITRARRGRNSRVGWDFVHVVVDDASRLAYVEVLPDEKRQSVTGFLVCALLRLRHIRTRPYTPKTNGKAERFIQTAPRVGLGAAVPQLRYPCGDAGAGRRGRLTATLSW
jgi:transposase InsO family protein